MRRFRLHLTLVALLTALVLPVSLQAATQPVSGTTTSALGISVSGAVALSNFSPGPIGRIVSARVTQLGPRRLGLTARIRNTGRVRGYPDRLRLHLFDAMGRIVFSAA